jgi:O-antigen/teichoic acid export membrane protein
MLKKLAGETALYGFSTIIGRLLNYLLIPIHTAAFLPKENGINVLLYSYVGIANVIFLYGMETAYFRYSRENEKHFFNIIQSSIIISSLFLGSIIFLYSGTIMNFIGFPGKGEFVQWMAILMATDAIFAIPFARLRYENRALKFVSTKIILILINVFLNIIFLLYLKPLHEGSIQGPDFLKYIYNPEIGVGYIILANLFANLSLIILLKNSWKGFHFNFNFKEFKMLWIYGYPIMFMSLASTINSFLDRILLSKILPKNYYENLTTESIVGIYGNAIKLAVFMSLAIQAYKYAAEPYFLSKTEGKEDKNNLALATHWFMIICLLLWVGISGNLSWIKILFLRQEIYWIGISIVPIVLLGNLFLGLYYNISVWFKLNDKTHFGSYITLAGLGINLLGNIIFIPEFGFIACAYSFLASTIFMTALCYVLGEKYYPVPYKVKNALAYILWGLICIYFPQLILKNIPEYISGNLGFLLFLISILFFEIRWKDGKPFIPKINE